MPNQFKAVVSVRSARCSTISILGFGTLFFLAAAFRFGIEVRKLYILHSFLGSAVGWYYLWLVGYSTLIGIWCDVVGAVGLCASTPRRSEDKCLIATFGIFCLILIGTLSYGIHDFRPSLSTWIKIVKDGRCDNSYFLTNCYLNVSLYGCYILFAAVVVLNSVWCVICCLGSLFILTTDVQPGEQDEEQQVPQPTTPQDMMMEDRPPMYNPGMQVSTDNLQGNSPMWQPSAPPIYPTM